MKSSKLAIQMMWVVLFALTGACFSAGVNAQDRSAGPPVMTGDADFEARSNTLRNMTAEKPAEKTTPVVRKDPKVVLEEARDDYRFLQVNNKALKLTLDTNKVIDPADVANFLTDIRKRAERLNENLALPELDKKAEHMKITPAATPAEFTASVSTLSGLIRSFITNPCFSRTGVARK